MIDLPWRFRFCRRFENWCWDKYGIPPKPKYFLQRAKRGYSQADAWNMHAYLEDVIIGLSEGMRENRKGAPIIIFDENGEDIIPATMYDGMRVWDSVLNDISEGMKSSRALDDCAENEVEELNKKFQKAMKLLANNWQSFWD